MKSHHPDTEIALGNPWYVADQFRAQFGTRGRRRVIEHRWEVFGAMIRDWCGGRFHAHPLTVLDAGCGDGINLLGLRRLSNAGAPAMRLLGVDYNPIRLARASRVSDTRLHQASLYQLPFASSAFDIVLCNHVLEHVPELDAAVSELYRVLGPGGLLIAGVPNEGCLLGRLRNRVIQHAISRTTDHVHFFTDKTFGDLLRRAGFHVRAIERETFFFPCSYVNACCNEFGIGHRLMDGLRRLFPSQAGGLIVACDKPVRAAYAALAEGR